MAEDEPTKKGYSVQEYMLFKLDRNIAIIGLITIAIWALLTKDLSADAGKIAYAVIGILGVYIGGRGGNKQ